MAIFAYGKERKLLITEKVKKQLENIRRVINDLLISFDSKYSISHPRSI
jgi:hypothetical protein